MEMAYRPLVMRCGAFGDMVLLTSLIRDLHHRFGQPVDIISSGGWTLPLLAGQPGVGSLYLIRSRRRPYFMSPDQWRLVASLRQRQPGPVWFLEPRRVGLKLLTRAGIDPQWIVDINSVEHMTGEHYLEHLRRSASQLPPALDGAMTSTTLGPAIGAALTVPADARIELEILLTSTNLLHRRLLLVQIGNKRTMRLGPVRRSSNNKYWPAENWRAVIGAMQARCPDHAILLLGVKQEHGLNENILSGLNANQRRSVYNLAGQLPIPRLLALLERADGMVGVDTGPAHAAAALGIPQVVLYGAASPSYYRPWGTAGAPAICVKNPAAASLEEVSVRDVVAAWESLPLRPSMNAGTS